MTALLYPNYNLVVGHLKCLKNYYVIFVAISFSLLTQRLFKKTFLMSMRFFNWIHEAYIKVTLSKTDCSFYLVEKMFVVQNDSISFMMETFDIFFFTHFRPTGHL